MLPPGSAATSVQAEATKSFMETESLSSESMTLQNRLSVPSLKSADSPCSRRRGPKPRSDCGRGIPSRSLHRRRVRAAVDFGAGRCLCEVACPGRVQAVAPTEIRPLTYGAAAVAMALGTVSVPHMISRGHRGRVRQKAAARALRRRGGKIAKRQSARLR
jgi:hypothetical protein